MFKLYKHQKKQNKKVRKELKKLDHVLYGASVGFGKSVALWDLIRQDLKNGERVLLLAPYRKLIFQLEETFATQQPHVLMGSIDRGSKLSGLILSSMDTMNSRLKKGSLDYEGIDKIYIDEVHISCNFPPLKNSRMELLYNKYWNSAKWVGFTATPITTNGYRLEGWDKTVYKYQTAKLIKMGYLADYDYFAPVDIDLSSLRTNTVGEYVAEDVEEVTNTPTAISSVKKIWKKHGKKKKVLIFASSIAHAKLLSQAIKGSFVIHSKLKEAEQTTILENFKMSKRGVLINVAMLTTGYDDPTIDMVVIARPIKSERLFIQCGGRGLRLYGDKRTLIFDMCSCYKSCGLPKDLRDFNKVKVAKKKGDIEPTDNTMRCALCDVVSPTNEYSITKKVKKKFILTKFTCPACEQLCKEVRQDLTLADNIEKVEDTEEVKYSTKQRTKIVGNLVEEHTSKMREWSRFIVKTIVYSGRGELLDQAIAKGTTTKTLWTKVMNMYGDAKNEEA